MGARIGILEGSLRRGSLSRAAGRAVPGLLPPDACAVALPSPGTLPHFDQDLLDAGIPAPVAALAAALGRIDALLVVTPEYNWSVPGALKNAIDWISRIDPNPLADMPAAVWSVSPGMLGGARVHEGLRHILLSQEMRVMAKPEVQIAQARTRIDVAAGAITDPQTEAFLRDHLARVAGWGTKSQVTERRVTERRGAVPARG